MQIATRLYLSQPDRALKYLTVDIKQLIWAFGVVYQVRDDLLQLPKDGSEPLPEGAEQKVE